MSACLKQYREPSEPPVICGTTVRSQSWQLHAHWRTTLRAESGLRIRNAVELLKGASTVCSTGWWLPSRSPTRSLPKPSRSRHSAARCCMAMSVCTVAGESAGRCRGDLLTEPRLRSLKPSAFAARAHRAGAGADLKRSPRKESSQVHARSSPVDPSMCGAARVTTFSVPPSWRTFQACCHLVRRGYLA